MGHGCVAWSWAVAKGAEGEAVGGGIGAVRRGCELTGRGVSVGWGEGVDGMGGGGEVNGGGGGGGNGGGRVGRRRGRRNEGRRGGEKGVEEGRSKEGR